jgi:ATP-dependent Lhr-like helicase
MNSPSSKSEASGTGLLDPRIQRWIWDRGWQELRDIQESAIRAVLESERDILIAAATASGKTEAAFLPVLSRIAEQPYDGIRALYVGPLKALINDQFQRLEELCEQLEVPVTRWHGDAPAAAKKRARERPAGILLITPESLEAIFMRRPEDLARMFAQTEFVVIDELHAFLDSERGIQLASQLKRLERRALKRPRRIGLSATIGDLNIAAAWLTSTAPETVTIIRSGAAGNGLRLQIRGVTSADPKESPAGAAQEGSAETEPHPANSGAALTQIAQHLFATLRGQGNHLVFAGSRKNTEALSDALRVLCETAGLPNEFFPHHGNLSREAREGLEQRLKDGKVPTTAVATTTLELGIDIGSVESVAQVGAPSSISSLRQRIGRSGRRAGKPSVLRIYAVEEPLDVRSSLFDRLRVETVQAVAAIDLLIRQWIEPPRAGGLHLSTLLHQTLSLICERGGVLPQAAFDLLGGEGPFSAVTPAQYAALLRGMADGLIEQAADQTLMLGKTGESLTSFYQFFAVFESFDEFSIIAGGKTLGTLSVKNALGPDDFIIFGGRRWRVLEIDDRTRKVFVEPAPAGRVPKFEGEAAPLHDELSGSLYRVYCDTAVPSYLDKVAQRHLQEGRQAFEQLGLRKTALIEDAGNIHLFPWCGTGKLDTLKLALRYAGLTVEQKRIHLSVGNADLARVQEVLRTLQQTTPPAEALTYLTEKLRNDKFDVYLPDALAREAFIHDKLELSALSSIANRLLSRVSSSENT